MSRQCQSPDYDHTQFQWPEVLSAQAIVTHLRDLRGGELRLGTLRVLTLAQSRGVSMNKLVEQFSAHALTAWDTENHFRAMTATGDVPKALAVLDRLHTEDGVAATR